MTQAHQIILLAHGSSDARWCETFEKLAEPTVESIENAAIAYMELAEPSLDTIVNRAKGQGVEQFTVVPLFLAAGAPRSSSLLTVTLICTSFICSGITVQL